MTTVYQQGDVPKEQWPNEIQLLKPVGVRIVSEPEGLFIVIEKRFVEEAGYFIPRHAKSFVPQAGSDPTFEPLVHDVYRYRVAG
jgi:hypothetical protein